MITEKYLWGGLTQLLAVYDGNGALVTRFEYATGRMPVAMETGGNTYYLAYDQVGSLRMIIDSTGAVVREITYDSFGNIITETGSGPSVPFGFAGGLHDRDTGLVRFGFRDYDPDVGRWTAKDPIGFAGEDTNLYAYVSNNPVIYADPTGELVNFAVGAAVGAGTGYALAILTGSCYTWQNALVDAALGATGAGLISKANKVYRIARLRSVAKSRGLRKVRSDTFIEDWQYPGDHLRRLTIKFQGSTKPNIHVDSKVPRFKYRFDKRRFWNPFTGEIGRKGALSHVPLEPKLSALSAPRVAAGASGGAIGQGVSNGLCDCN